MYLLYLIITGSDPKPEMPPGSFYKPKFFEFMKEEFLACREGVGIIDMSSFSKIEIKVHFWSSFDFFLIVLNMHFSQAVARLWNIYKDFVLMM